MEKTRFSSETAIVPLAAFHPKSAVTNQRIIRGLKISRSQLLIEKRPFLIFQTGNQRFFISPV